MTDFYKGIPSGDSVKLTLKIREVAERQEKCLSEPVRKGGKMTRLEDLIDKIMLDLLERELQILGDSGYNNPVLACWGDQSLGKVNKLFDNGHIYQNRTISDCVYKLLHHSRQVMERSQERSSQIQKLADLVAKEKKA